jgi:hypothetical protein
MVPISAVALASSVDYMVAAGSHAGIVTVFQVPKIVTNPLQLQVSHITTSVHYVHDNI